MYKALLKPLLFLLQPEKAHHITTTLLKLILKIPGISHIFKMIYKHDDPKLSISVAGINFPNRIGLAAGFDKDGKYYKEMAALGFGFIEIGTVTPLPQPGNDKPRLFRLPKDHALINRMGFNNDGIDAMAERLKKARQSGIIIGGNIGKNKVTPNEEATSDYIKCFNTLYEYVDYFVVNVSSPNTPGLRELQEKAPLMHLLQSLMVINNKKAKQKPIFLKIAPDLNKPQLDDILEIVQNTGIAGIIATNTTVDRTDLVTDTSAIGNGGLSGVPLKNKSTEIIRYLYEKSSKKLLIIGVGGIHTPEDAIEKIKAGAVLVQLYTGLIYEGPGLIKNIKKQLLKEGI
ncbi:MAG: quinone-dependent dihydroorotate dehydrogenase [Saprospiraceae bacterium]|nr:MAG: dihydroorotate dehydrogenase [Bacteroidetes bacterium OLB9]MCO6463959.1 quinone-dependent dihydroorotate dehydrogenase [Saprospiraceae bacterium]MCZ2337348.1 quinone-dependent dihydroorotate dehydrogenase [Chitinophagales bacterium]